MDRLTPTGDRQLLQWRTTFPGSGDIPVIAIHRVRHPDCQAHSHDFIEMVLIAGGKGTQRTAAGDLGLTRGDIIVLRPGGWHAYVDCEGLEIYNVAFGTDLLHHELAWALEDPALSFLLLSGPLALTGNGILHLHLADDITARCQRHIDDFCELCERHGSPQTGSDRAQRVGLLLLVLGDVLEGAEIRGGPACSVSGLHPAVARGMRLLEQDISRDWSLAELAAKVGLERSYLIRQFKNGTGMPPMTYLGRRRAERAASLVAHTREPIAAIAQQVGWTDPVHFARRFRKVFGMSASQYRQRFAETETDRLV